MNTSMIRLVPTYPADAESVASALGLTKEILQAEESSQSPEAEWWLTSDGKTAAYWTADELLGLDYITVYGAEAGVLARKIRSIIQTDGIPQLQARISSDRDTDTLIDSTYRTAVVACSGYDPQAFSLLCRVLKDPDPMARRASLVAVSITGWGEFIPVLDEISGQETVEAIRDQAARVRDALTENSPKSPPLPQKHPGDRHRAQEHLCRTDPLPTGPETAALHDSGLPHRPGRPRISSPQHHLTAEAPCAAASTVHPDPPGDSGRT